MLISLGPVSGSLRKDGKCRTWSDLHFMLLLEEGARRLHSGVRRGSPGAVAAGNCSRPRTLTTAPRRWKNQAI